MKKTEYELGIDCTVEFTGNDGVTFRIPVGDKGQRKSFASRRNAISNISSDPGAKRLSSTSVTIAFSNGSKLVVHEKNVRTYNKLIKWYHD